MAAITRIALLAIERLSGPRVILSAVPGGVKAVAKAAGVTSGRVSQVLRLDPLPYQWAVLLSELIGCTTWEVYQQLGQKPQGSPLGPLFDPGARESGTGRVGQSEILI